MKTKNILKIGFSACVSFLLVVGVASALTVFSVPQGGTGVGTITGIVKGNGASAFTAISGTSSQFVKGDGSLDTNTYLTSVGTGVANQLTYWSGTNALGSLDTATYPSLTELSYVKGVTSGIQSQLNSKGTFVLPTLTSGSVLYSNGSTIAQDNANFFWDATNHRLGIGTTTPADVLHILKTGSDHQLAIDATGQLSTIDFMNGGTLKSQMYWDNSAGAFTIGGVGVAATFTSTGVGIGTASPADVLHILKTGSDHQLAIDATGQLSTIDFMNGGTLKSQIYWDNSAGAFTIGGVGVAATFTSTGVGIGTASPLSTLDVNGGVAIGSYAGNNAAGSGNLIVSGNVGIGTASPFSSLQVIGKTILGAQGSSSGTFYLAPSVGDNQLYLSSATSPTTDTGTSLSLGGRYNTANQIQIAYGSIVGARENAINTNLNGYLSFWTANDNTNSSVERMRINSSGNVGIGTTNPNITGIKLVVGQSANTSGDGIQSVSDSGAITLTSFGSTDSGINSGITQGFKLIGAGSYPIVISHNSAQPIIFGTNDMERMRIDSTGNVGIGTTGPNAKLDVNGDIIDEKASGYTNYLVCYLSTGQLGHMTQTALLAGAGSATCVAN